MKRLFVSIAARFGLLDSQKMLEHASKGELDRAVWYAESIYATEKRLVSNIIDEAFPPYRLEDASGAVDKMLMSTYPLCHVDDMMLIRSSLIAILCTHSKASKVIFGLRYLAHMSIFLRRAILRARHIKEISYDHRKRFGQMVDKEDDKPIEPILKVFHLPEQKEVQISKREEFSRMQTWVQTDRLFTRFRDAVEYMHRHFVPYWNITVASYAHSLMSTARVANEIVTKEEMETAQVILENIGH